MSTSLDGVDPRLVAGFNQLAQVCNISVSSGIRTEDEQVDLYRRWQAGEPGIYMPAKPASLGGSGSPHNRGQAIDVDGDLACAQRNAPQFGMVFPFGDGGGGGADPPHMEWAGGGEDYQSATQADYDDRDGNPTTAPQQPVDPVPGIMGAVTAALKGDRTELVSVGSIEELSNALGKKPESPAIEQTTGAPGAPGTAVGNSFYEKVLNGIGAPITPENIRTMEAWAQAEGYGAPRGVPLDKFNPFATTEANTPGVTGYHNILNGKPGVKYYESEDAGVQATIKTLQNGLYSEIVEGFRTNDMARAAAGIENSPWGTGGLVRKILGV